MCKLKERDRKLSLLSHWLWSRSHGLSIGQTLPSCSCLKIKATITTIFWAWTPTLKQGTETCTMRFILFFSSLECATVSSRLAFGLALYVLRMNVAIKNTTFFALPKDDARSLLNTADTNKKRPN